MLAKIKELFTSKKFIMVVIGSAVVGALTYFGAPQELINSIAALFGVGVAGQGLADFGKSSAPK